MLLGHRRRYCAHPAVQRNDREKEKKAINEGRVPQDCKGARLPDPNRLCGARVLISVLVMTSKESPDMTTWPSFVRAAAPPRDPNVDDDEEENDDDEVDDDREPAIIREPDEDE